MCDEVVAEHSRDRYALGRGGTGNLGDKVTPVTANDAWIGCYQSVGIETDAQARNGRRTRNCAEGRTASRRGVFMPRSCQGQPLLHG